MSRENATAQALADLTAVPFQWGQMDCCRFADEIVSRVTGRSIMRGFSYQTEDEALRMVEQAGSLEFLITKTIGSSPVSPSDVEDGDPVLVETSAGPTVGVRYQDRVVFKARAGLRSWPLDGLRVLCGWKVPCQQ